MRPHLSKYWKIPPDGNAAFVACMEDVLELYHAPYDARFPQVCMDESSKQLVGEVHEPIPVAPGRAKIEDHEYVRNGVAEIFIEVEPLAGRRHVEITERRTRVDWAGFIVSGHFKMHHLWSLQSAPPLTGVFLGFLGSFWQGVFLFP